MSSSPESTHPEPANRLQTNGLKDNDSPDEGRVVERRPWLLGIASIVLGAACGGEVPAPASARRAKGQRRFDDPSELFPADLDLVVRVDLGRMRAQLGPAAELLTSRGWPETERGEEIVSHAIRRANVVWIGMRLADVDAGDRVLLVEGDLEDLRPDRSTFEPVDPPLADQVRTWERRGPLARASTARVHAFSGRMIAFVTPVEIDSVERVLKRGPDARRRDPSAEGVLSVDVRGKRLPPSLERRFPSIAAIIGGLSRARASATMRGDALRIDAEIQANDGRAATKAEGLLHALREGGMAGRYASLFEDVRIERIERAIRVRWRLSTAVLRGLLEGGAGEAEDVQAGP